LFSYDRPNVGALLVSSTFALFLVLQITFKPFLYPNANRLEAILLGINYLIVTIALMTAETDSTAIGILIIIIGSIGFLLAIGYNLAEFLFNMGFKQFRSFINGEKEDFVLALDELQ
jgi:hypothetical protein